MGSKNSPPPPPDYSGLIAASTEAAKGNLAFQKEQFAWAKQAYTENKAITDQVATSFLDTQRVNSANAAKDRARYEQVFQPLEDQLVADANSFASPERRELEMGRAQAGVAQSFDAQRNNSLRQLEGYGIAPDAARYGGLDAAWRAQQAAAQAAAGNQASQMVDATGRALRSEAINVGARIPGAVAGQYGTALQAGTGGVNSSLSTTASGANSMGTATQYAGLQNQALGTAGNMMNASYQNELNAYKAENEASSGLGSALGLAGSLIGTAKSASGAAGLMAFMADGGSVTPGGAIPMSASPTGGAAIDDVPAALTAGEFVMPKDVTSWLGEKAMHSLIEKARKEQQDIPQRSGAIPSKGQMPQQPPTFSSRPSGALPVG